MFRRQYKEALELLKEGLPPKLQSTDVAARKSMVEGVAYRYAQDFENSKQKFVEAEKLASSYQPQLMSEILNNRGALEAEQRKYADAQETFHRGLLFARMQKNQVQEANALGNLGFVATRREHFDEALGWNRSALELARSLNMKDTVGVILGNMAWNEFDLGDFENALPLYADAAKDSEQRKIPATQAYWLTGVANSHYALREYQPAQAVFEKALDIARGLDEKSILTECLNGLSDVELQMGRVDLAQIHNREALEIERQGLDKSGILDSRLIKARIDASRGHFLDAERAFQAMMRDPGADRPMIWSSHAWLAKTYDTQGKVSQADKEYQLSLAEITEARNALPQDEFRLTFLASAMEFYDDYVDSLVAHGRADRALKVAELSRARTLTEGLEPDSPDDPDSAAKLRPQEIAKELNATLLFYWVGHNQSYLWVISSAKTTYFKLPKASEIEALVKSYSKALPDVDEAQDAGATDGKKLYAMLVEPARKLIDPGSRVILLPAEGLYGLSFDTLIVPDPKPHFWIEDVTLTTASSLTLLDASLRRPATTGKDLLLVGNAVPTPGFPALTQAPAEIQKVGHYFSEPNRKVLEAKEATASAYLNSNPEKYAYVHFVTHGTASRTRPLESAVILSPDGDSYKLYARDVVAHHLSAELVTISACNTSGSRTISGEGLVGLSWAFLRAGAHNVIGALWEVSDVSTPQLMDSLYGGLKQGKDPATALRDAKLSLLHTRDPNSVFKMPFYWAPFQLYAGS